MNGSGCKNCPVKGCQTTQYHGSTCSAQRAQYGLGDPKTNADEFRESSDEELVEKLYGAVAGTVEGLLEVLGIQTEVGKIIRGESYKKALLTWLQSPAEVGNEQT